MIRRASVIVALIAVAFASVASKSAGENPPAPAPAPAQGQPEAQQATVTKIVVRRPHKVVHMKRKFTPTLRPSPSYVRNVILPMEAARAGISAAALQNRASCESGFRYWATNGQYVGILQFGANAFYRGLHSIGSRRVVLREVKYRRMHSKVIRYWSDGRVTWHKGRIRRQAVVVKLVGHSSTYQSDPWTQARIGAQAIAGRSAVSSGEWECGT